MNNISIFNQQYPAGTTRIVKSQDGNSEVYCRHAIGEINGESRSIPALVCAGFSTEDKWAIVSLTSGLNNLKYVGSVAILGANDSEQAEDWAKRYFGLYAGASGAQFTGYASAQALQLLLDNSASAENLPIRNTSICKYEGLVSLTPVVWNDDQLASPVLAKLVHEMGLLDTYGQLLDPVTVADLPILVHEMGGVHQEYDALIVDYSKMDLLAERLNTSMSKASVGDIKPINLTQTRPFKRNGVTNVAMVFELSDGQSITIVFHNPDSTPTKLAAHDTMTSWKWMLNKRDVTAAVSPKEGDNVQLPVLAKRILTLVEKNSARFKRANATKDTQVQELNEITDRVASKQTELEVVLGEIKLLEKQIDGVGTASKEDQLPIKGPITMIEDYVDFKDFTDVYIDDIGNENLYFIDQITRKPYATKLLNLADFTKGQKLDLWSYVQGKYPEEVKTTDHYSKQILDALVAGFGWALAADGATIGKTFEGLGADGDLANGARTLTAKFDERGRYLAVTDNAAETGGHIIPSTDLDCRPFVDDPAKGAETFNKRVDDYVEGERAAQVEVAKDASDIYAKYITVAADDVSSLRRQDIYRVLDESGLTGSELQGLADYISAGKPIFAKVVESELKDLLANRSATNPDADYLNSIIDSSADMTQGDAMQAELEAIAERLTPEIEPLFEKAVDVYAAYQVAQASALV